MPDQDTINTLRAARALIEQGWTQGALARSAKNRKVKVTSDRACQFCAAGAVYRVLGREKVPYGEKEWQPFELLQQVIELHRFHGDRKFYSIPAFNDAPATTKADVLWLYDRAISLAEC